MNSSNVSNRIEGAIGTETSVEEAFRGLDISNVQVNYNSQLSYIHAYYVL